MSAKAAGSTLQASISMHSESREISQKKILQLFESTSADLRYIAKKTEIYAHLNPDRA